MSHFMKVERIDIERAERLAVVEHVNRPRHLTGVKILKAFNRSKVSEFFEPRFCGDWSYFAERRIETNGQDIVSNIIPLRHPITVGNGISDRNTAPHAGNGLAVVSVASGIQRIGIGEIHGGVAFTPDDLRRLLGPCARHYTH